MKKTKAVLAILMAGTMMLGLAGCGGNSSSATQGTTAGTGAGCVWASREQMQDEYTLPGAFKAYRKRMGL